MNLEHWEIALRTGLGTGLLVVILTFTPLRAVFRHRFGNSVAIAVLTMIGDAYSHSYYGGIRSKEVMLTGLTSGIFALLAGFALEDRGRRLRALWSALRPK
jgi:xanthine/uracil/vitamin C permease (AzgA family)